MGTQPARPPTSPQDHPAKDKNTQQPAQPAVLPPPAWGPGSRAGNFYWDAVSRVFQPAYDLHSIPGPKPTSWLLGNIPDVDRNDYHLQALQWAEEYGPICKFRLAFQYVVLVTDPHLAAQLLGRGPHALPRKSIGYTFFDLATNNFGGTSFFTTTNERHWQAVRKATAPAFSHSNIRAVFPVALKHAEELAEHLGAAALADQESGGTPHGVEVQEGLEHMLLAVFLEGMYRVSPEQLPCTTLADGLNLLLEEANCRIRFPFRGPLLRFIDPQRRKAVAAAQEALAAIYGRIVDTFLERSPPRDDDTSLWACLARMRDPDTGRPLTKEQLVPDVGVLIVAGYDTSSHTIAWTLRLIAEHPEVQHRIHEELREAGLLRVPQDTAAASTACPGCCQHEAGACPTSTAADGTAGLHAAGKAGNAAATAMEAGAGAEAGPGGGGVGDTGSELASSDSCSVDGQEGYVDVAACLAPAGEDGIAPAMPSIPTTANTAAFPAIKAIKAIPVSRSSSSSSSSGDTPSNGSSSSSSTTSSHSQDEGTTQEGNFSKLGVDSTSSSSSSGRQPTLEDLGSLTYLNCVIDESMRLFPVAATASVRETTEACQVGPYRVPKGTMVWPMVFAIHRSTTLWDRPHDFVPERWLQPGTAYYTPDKATSSPGGKACSQEASKPAAAAAAGSRQRVKRFMPFSDGMKSCMGQALGMLEVRATLVAILSRYWVQLPPSAAAGSCGSSQERGGGLAGSGSTQEAREQAGSSGKEEHKGRAGEAAMLMALTLKMKDGLRLHLTPHGHPPQ